MSIMRIAGAIALFALLATPVRAAEPLQPTGKWNVDYGDAHCIAMRPYGSPSSPLTLVFKPSPMGDVMQLSLVQASRRSDVNEYAGAISLDGKKDVPVSLLGFLNEGTKQRINTIILTPDVFASIRTARTLRIRASGEVDATITLSQMEKIAQTLDNCVADLRKLWHLGASAEALKHGAVNRKPLSRLFSTSDYPGAALRKGSTGMVQVMLLIDQVGKIASCMVTETSGVASLDAQTCIILGKRARFDPAVGLDGKPARSGTTARIKWDL